jgi:hypothetical protein
MDAYIESIPTIGAGNVSVSKESNWVYIVDFLGELANQDLPPLDVDYTNLPSPATVEITTTINGSGSDEIPIEPPPETGNPQQDAINMAYYVLVKSRHRGPYSWPEHRDHTLQAIEALYPYQTIDAAPETAKQAAAAKQAAKQEATASKPTKAGRR